MKNRKNLDQNKIAERVEWIQKAVESMGELFEKGASKAANDLRNEITRELHKIDNPEFDAPKPIQPIRINFLKYAPKMKFRTQWLIPLIIVIICFILSHAIWTFHLKNRHGLTGHYFSRPNLKKLVLKRHDSNINFRWYESRPAEGLPRNHFSVRWTGSIKIPKDNVYKFTAVSDDGVRVFIDKNLIINNWKRQKPSTKIKTINLKRGVYPIKVEYFDGYKDAFIQLFWDRGKPGHKEIIPSRYFLPNQG